MPLCPCICPNTFSSKRSISTELVTDITPLHTTAPVPLQCRTNKNANMAEQLTYGEKGLPHQCHLNESDVEQKLFQKYMHRSV
jgi:hypothetical protein